MYILVYKKTKQKQSNNNKLPKENNTLNLTKKQNQLGSFILKILVKRIFKFTDFHINKMLM